MKIIFNDTDNSCVCASVRTSLTAHILAMDPMLLVMVTSVALARSSLLMLSRFSLLIMWPKLWKHIIYTTWQNNLHFEHKRITLLSSWTSLTNKFTARNVRLCKSHIILVFFSTLTKLKLNWMVWFDKLLEKSMMRGRSNLLGYHRQQSKNPGTLLSMLINELKLMLLIWG